MPYKHGKRVDKTVKQLVTDTRQMLLPHTASHLKERKTNTLKDFVAVAGPLGVSHLVIFSQTENTGNIQFRIGRLANGPTLTFRVEGYSLAHQIKAAQKRPIDFTGLYLTPPLVVLHNFNTPSNLHNVTTKESVSLANALKLTQVTFQNMFPAINPATLKLVDCRRVLLVHYDRRTSRIELRHFAIRAVPVGVTKGVKKILLQSKVPDLGKLDDMAEFVLSGGKTGANGGMTSDSEFEDESSKVILPQDYHGKGNQKSSQSAIKLTEIGPRLSLSLVKIEDGLFNGEVLYHAYVSKTAEETAVLRKRAQEREELRMQRRTEQALNVKRKTEEKEAKRKAKEERKAQRQAAAEKAAAEGKLGDDDDDENMVTNDDGDNDEEEEDSDDDRNNHRNVPNDGDNDDDDDADEEEDDDVSDDDSEDANDATALKPRYRSSNTQDYDEEGDDDGHVEVDDIDENDEVSDDEDDDDDDNEGTTSRTNVPYTMVTTQYESDSDDDDDDEDDDEESDGDDDKDNTNTKSHGPSITVKKTGTLPVKNGPVVGNKRTRDEDKAEAKNSSKGAIKSILKSSSSTSSKPSAQKGNPSSQHNATAPIKTGRVTIVSNKK